VTIASYEAVIHALEEAAGRTPSLRPTASLYVDLLRLQQAVDPRPVRPAPAHVDADRRIRLGEPLLDAAEWSADEEVLAPLGVQMAYTTARHRPELAKALLRISGWFVSHQVDLGDAASSYLHGDLDQWSAHEGLDAGLHRFVFSHALAPFLRGEAARLLPLLDQSAWFKGACPICGGDPDMAALEGDGERHLLCSRCDAEWPFLRATCPFCGAESGIGFYTPLPGYRLYTCDSCRRYIKTVDRREMAHTNPLPAERILSAGLDVAAQAAGWGVAAEPLGAGAPGAASTPG
jgi:FdhE protein